jgi:hypothetical protein
MRYPVLVEAATASIRCWPARRPPFGVGLLAGGVRRGAIELTDHIHTNLNRVGIKCRLVDGLGPMNTTHYEVPGTSGSSDGLCSVLACSQASVRCWPARRRCASRRHGANGPYPYQQPKPSWKALGRLQTRAYASYIPPRSSESGDGLRSVLACSQAVCVAAPLS